MKSSDFQIHPSKIQTYLNELSKLISSENTNISLLKKWEAIYSAINGVSYREIAKKYSISPNSVRFWIKNFITTGKECFLKERRGGARNRITSFDNEKSILEELIKNLKHTKRKSYRSDTIKFRFEHRLGRKISYDYVYAVLKRHQWKKHPIKQFEKIDKNKKIILTCYSWYPPKVSN